MKPLIVFDLDGTLVDSLPDICTAVNIASNILGLGQISLQEVQNTLGFGFLHTVTRCINNKYARSATKHQAPIDDAIIDDAKKKSLSYYLANPVKETKVYQGINELLCDLTEKGWGLAVLSNKDEALVKQVCTKLLSHVPFFAVKGYLPTFPRKPDPTVLNTIINEHRSTRHVHDDDIAQTMDRNSSKKYTINSAEYPIYMVGDSHADLETAKNAGIHFLGALWGYYDAHDSYSKKREFTSPDDLRRWLKRN